MLFSRLKEEPKCSRAILRAHFIVTLNYLKLKKTGKVLLLNQLTNALRSGSIYSAILLNIEIKILYIYFNKKNNLSTL